MKKIKWISIADIHLRLNDTLGIIKNGINTRLRDRLVILNKISKDAAENGVDFVVFLGDTFHRFNSPERLQYYFIKAIEPLLIKKLPIYFIIGNHETDMYSYNFMATDALSTHEKLSINIIGKTAELKIGKYTFYFISAMHTDEEIIEKLRNIEDKENSIVFGHWETKEALIGEDEIRYRNGIHSKEYNGFKRVYLGDFHKYQRYDNWMYVGSLCRQNFSEKSDRKGFIQSELYIEENEIKDEFIVVNDRELIEINIDENTTIESLKHIDTKSAIVKLKFKGSREWYIPLDKQRYTNIFYENGAHKVVTDYINIREVEIQDTKVSVASSFEDDIEEYMRRNDREDLIKPSIDILQRVKENE